MLEIHNTQPQASSQSGSSSSTSVIDAHIADEVLGTRCRFKREPPINDDSPVMRGSHSRDDRSTTAINRGSGGTDSAYAEDFVIASSRYQYVYLCSYPSRVHFNIVYHDAPASAIATLFRQSSTDSSRR
ncbi:hypothetical protein PanWU01x14_180960 [Parasponia andersonii]|uniref:Uncharacterized protein n=1 Tax=Parasponia andersonii TaxID=3476 RepID=A0A2P5C674_PARAD|nr:hypothetical protein PanWU01x14_180960 [Parasponia andersonii]